MSRTYNSKGYVFDDEVTAWLEKLKVMHGSYNKGLRLVAFAESGESIPTVAEVGRVSGKPPRPRPLAQGRQAKAPLLKPSQQGKKASK